jgi:hypothetical protein
MLPARDEKHWDTKWITCVLGVRGTLPRIESRTSPDQRADHNFVGEKGGPSERPWVTLPLVHQSRARFSRAKPAPALAR